MSVNNSPGKLEHVIERTDQNLVVFFMFLMVNRASISAGSCVHMYDARDYHFIGINNKKNRRENCAKMKSDQQCEWMDVWTTSITMRI